MNDLDFIKKTLVEASSIAKKHFGSVSQSVKPEDRNQVLTEADIAIGNHIVSEIKKQFPEDNIIDEEAGVVDNRSQRTWVVDPIDGTSNFAEGLPTYGCMIGLLDNTTPVAGGIALPAFEEIYLGGSNSPATLNDSPISVSKKTLENSLVAYGIDGHPEAPQKTAEEAEILRRIILEIRNLRTTNSAFDMAHVCNGSYGLFLNQTTKIWDNVAVQAIVEAAGGICTDFYGNKLDYSQPLSRIKENYTICAGAPHLHTQMQELLHA